MNERTYKYAFVIAVMMLPGTCRCIGVCHAGR